MAVLTGHDNYKKHIKTDNGYKLVSQWTSSDTVEFDDGDNLSTKVGSTDISGVGGGSITGAIADLDTNKADLVNGKVPLSQIPATAINVRVEVANDTARFALTTAQAQTGDTVKVLSTEMIYLVVDDTHLDTEAGYMAYAQTVTWDTISGKPSNLTYFEEESYQTGSTPSPVLRQSDIVANLTTTTPGKVLDATQGKLLNDSVAAIQAQISAIHKKINYSYTYSIAANGTLSVSGTDLNIGTPTGYTPFAVSKIITGGSLVIARNVNINVTDDSTAVQLINLSSSAVSDATLQIEIGYIKTDTLS